MLFGPGANGQIFGIREVLHGREYKKSRDDGHDRRGRRRAHVEHGGRRVFHHSQVRDALAEVGQSGRTVRRHQQRRQRVGDGHVHVFRSYPECRVPGVRLFQPVYPGPGENPANVFSVTQQHRSGGRVLQVAVANVPGRDTGQAVRLQHGQTGQLPAELLAGERVAGGVQPERFQAAAVFAGGAQATGVDGAVLRAKLQDERDGVHGGGGGQPVRADADTERGRFAARVQGQADGQQLRRAGGGHGRGVVGATGKGRHENGVQPAGQHGPGQSGQDAHQLLQRRQRVADQREVRAFGADHHRVEFGTRVRPERVFESRQRYALFVETDARQHKTDIEATVGLQG